MTPAEIHARIKERFEEQVLEFEESLLNPSIKLVPEVAAEVGKYLKDDSELQFNYLMCLSGVDYGAGQPLGVVYHLQSMTLMHQIVLKVELPRASPSVPSVALIWRTADWHERDAYDLFGVRFEGHPDPRRIFLPDDSAKTTWCKSFITTYGCRSRTSTQTVAPMSLAHQVRGRNRDLRPEGVFYQCVRGDLDGAGGDALDVLAPVYPLGHIAVPR